MIPNRAQSEVVGLIMVFGITMLSIGVILATGMPVLTDAEENAQVERVQTEFSSLNQEIRESVHRPGQSGASVELSDGGVRVDDGAESLGVTITYDNETGDEITTGEMELGGLIYDTGDAGVAYQMGGVWATYRDGGYAMRTPPDISYTGTSLNLELVNFTNDVDVRGTGAQNFLVRSEGTHRSDELEAMTNRSLSPGTLSINVSAGSDFDDAWTEYFNRTFGADRTDGSNDGYANVSVRTGPPLFGVEYLVDRYDGSGMPAIGDEEVLLYDSDIGDENRYNSTVDVEDGGLLGGILGGELDLPVSESDINACHTSNVEQNLEDADEPVTAGAYEVDSTLTDDYSFDTSNGPVEIHVTANNLNINSEITVEGDNPVVFYGDVNRVPDTHLEDDRTELFQIYTTRDNPITVTDDYNGTIYAPETEVTVNDKLRGAAIADQGVNVNGEYYHDTALRQADLSDCIRQRAPVSNFEAVEHRVSMR